MYITRYKVKIIKNKLKKFINNQKKYNKKTKFYKLAQYVCRSKNISINYNIDILDNIYFITNNIDKHWAETDGKNIYLNNIKNFNYETLYYTIKHELIHGMILRYKKYELSEYNEHRFMYLYDKKLI